MSHHMQGVVREEGIDGWMDGWVAKDEIGESVFLETFQTTVTVTDTTPVTQSIMIC